jgi:hypothetical protein
MEYSGRSIVSGLRSSTCDLPRFYRTHPLYSWHGDTATWPDGTLSSSAMQFKSHCNVVSLRHVATAGFKC